jgi:segregation and condensation protein A
MGPDDASQDAALSDAEFDAAPVDEALDPTERLLLDIGGYEGPIDVLLDMARGQKVDLLSISILQLAEQYLAFIERAARG